jgi:hypothetical protein
MNEIRGVVVCPVMVASTREMKSKKRNSVGEPKNRENRSQTHRQPFPFLARTLATCDTVIGRVGGCGWWHGWR